MAGKVGVKLYSEVRMKSGRSAEPREAVKNVYEGVITDRKKEQRR